MAKKQKNGNNKKLHSKLLKQKKQREADKKAERLKKIKAMNQKINSTNQSEG